MYRSFVVLLSALLSISCMADQHHLFSEPYSWAVVGAGPAGITTIGVLLDLGVAADQICWIDTEFNVGRLGKYYTNVPSNSTAQEFIDFIAACRTFQACNSAALQRLYAYTPTSSYPLHIIVEPLQDITIYLLTRIPHQQTVLSGLDYTGTFWIVTTADHQRILAKNVVLATGSHPKTGSYTVGTVIPLDEALDTERLATHVEPEDTIAVVGSSHSAILILKFLSELPLKRIINFFIHPLQYAFDEHNNLIHGNGLRGDTAHWAKTVLEQNPPANLLRVYNSAPARQELLGSCNKIIYAMGYERNQLPPITQFHAELYDRYNSSTGVIAPGLFGIGIAFPEKFVDIQGNICASVGLLDFMAYAQEVVPLWLQNRQPATHLAPFASLLKIRNL